LVGAIAKSRLPEPRSAATAGNGGDYLVELRGAVKTYTGPAGAFTALYQVNLQVRAGEFLAIVGKSGSGKSTLINLITGIDRPSAGQVFVGGTALHCLGEGQLAAWRGRAVGLVFQFFQLLPALSVVENVMLPMDFGGVYAPGERYGRALALLEEVDMAGYAGRLPSALSGGQQQRAAIARALANDPPLLVADEPTGNLDSATATAVFRLFERLAAEGKTILMVTHDDELAQRAGRTILIADGRIVEESKT
jgi:putative ABC transport system ATP-binding protein